MLSKEKELDVLAENHIKPTRLANGGQPITDNQLSFFWPNIIIQRKYLPIRLINPLQDLCQRALKHCVQQSLEVYDTQTVRIRSIRMNVLLPKTRSVRMSLEVYEFQNNFGQKFLKFLKKLVHLKQKCWNITINFKNIQTQIED